MRLRVPEIAAFGVGAAGLVVGSVTGGIFLSKLDALKARCPANHCAYADQAEARSIGTLGTISTVSLIVGGVGAVTGGVLLLTQRIGGGSPSAKPGQSAFSSGDRGFALALTPSGVSARGWF